MQASPLLCDLGQKVSFQNIFLSLLFVLRTPSTTSAKYHTQFKRNQSPKTRFFVANALGISWHTVSKSNSSTSTHDGALGFQPSRTMNETSPNASMSPHGPSLQVFLILNGNDEVTYFLNFQFPLLQMVFQDEMNRDLWHNISKVCLLYLQVYIDLAILFFIIGLCIIMG